MRRKMLAEVCQFCHLIGLEVQKEEGNILVLEEHSVAEAFDQGQSKSHFRL